MYLFDIGDLEEFLLFMQNINMNLVVSEMLGMGAKVQYLFKLVRGEALRQFDSLCSDVKITESLNVEWNILLMVLS